MDVLDAEVAPRQADQEDQRREHDRQREEAIGPAGEEQRVFVAAQQIGVAPGGGEREDERAQRATAPGR